MSASPGTIFQEWKEFAENLERERDEARLHAKILRDDYDYEGTEKLHWENASLSHGDESATPQAR